MDITKEKIIEIIKEATDNKVEISLEQSKEMLDDLGFDSLDRSTIYLELEENYETEFSENEIEQMESVDGIFNVIQAKS